MLNIIKQLKALGYLIDEKEDHLQVARDFGAQIIVTKTNPISFSSCYKTNNNGFTNYNGFLRYVNDLNISSIVATFVCIEKGLLEFSARYCGLYDIATFAEFIRAWELDTSYLLDKNEKTEIYLMPDEELDKAMESYCHVENVTAEA